MARLRVQYVNQDVIYKEDIWRSSIELFQHRCQEKPETFMSMYLNSADITVPSLICDGLQGAVVSICTSISMNTHAARLPEKKERNQI